LFVEFGHAVIGDEELAAIGIGSAVCHGDDSSAVVFDCVNDLVLERSTVDTLTDFSSPGRVSSLDDETCLSHLGTFDVTMEKGVVVLVTGSKGKEVFASFRA
jgi:hypothetical protein